MIKLAKIWDDAYPGPKGDAQGPPGTPARPGAQQPANTQNLNGKSKYSIDISKFHPWENPYAQGVGSDKEYANRAESVTKWLNDPANANKVNLKPTPTSPSSYDFTPKVQTNNMSYMDLYNKSKNYLRSTPLWQRGDNSDFLKRYGFVKASSANLSGLVKAADALDFTDPNAKAFMRGEIGRYKAGTGTNIYSHANETTQWQNVDRQFRPVGWSMYGSLPLYRNYSYLTEQFGGLSSAKPTTPYASQPASTPTPTPQPATPAPQPVTTEQRRAQHEQFKKDHADIYNSQEYKQMTSSPEYKQSLQASQQKIDQQYAPTEKYLQHWQNVADSMKRSQEIMNRQDTQVANENTMIQNMAGQMGSGFNKDNPMDVVHYMDQQVQAKRQAAASATGDEKARLDAEVKSLQSAAVRARSQAVDAAKKDPNLMSDFAQRHGRHNVGSTLMDDSVTKPYYNQALKDQQTGFRAKEQVENSGISGTPTRTANTAPQPAKPATPQPAAKPATPAKPQPAAKPATPVRPATR